MTLLNKKKNTTPHFIEALHYLYKGKKFQANIKVSHFF